MYEKSNKERLYWLMDKYMVGKIDEDTFCDEFYYCYDLELDKETLTDVEKKAFFELSQIVSRFSRFESDHELDANAFSTPKELEQQVGEVRRKLNQYWPRN